MKIISGDADVEESLYCEMLEGVPARAGYRICSSIQTYLGTQVVALRGLLGGVIPEGIEMEDVQCWKAGSVEVKKDAVIKRCLLGDKVVIGEGASVLESVVGAGCKIGGGCHVSRCCLSAGCRVESDCQLIGSYVHTNECVQVDLTDAIYVNGTAEALPPILMKDGPNYDQMLTFLESETGETLQREAVKRDDSDNTSLYRDQLLDLFYATFETRLAEDNFADCDPLLENLRMEINNLWKSSFPKITFDVHLSVVTTSLFQAIWQDCLSCRVLKTRVEACGGLIRRLAKK
eukprot:Platyproteum_vivax@DN2519_c0_g1_i1.p1